MSHSSFAGQHHIESILLDDFFHCLAERSLTHLPLGNSVEWLDCIHSRIPPEVYVVFPTLVNMLVPELLQICKSGYQSCIPPSSHFPSTIHLVMAPSHVKLMWGTMRCCSSRSAALNATKIPSRLEKLFAQSVHAHACIL